MARRKETLEPISRAEWLAEVKSALILKLDFRPAEARLDKAARTVLAEFETLCIEAKRIPIESGRSLSTRRRRNSAAANKLRAAAAVIERDLQKATSPSANHVGT
jgi:hypothetical protein